MGSAVTATKLEQQAARMILSLNDFEEALSYLYAKPAANATVVRRALLTSAIVAYARPFSENERGQRSQATAMVALRPKKLLTPEQLSLHNCLLDIRNRAIAHSTSEVRPVIHKVIRPAGSMSGHFVFDVMTQSIDRPLFASLCDVLHGACRKGLAEINDRIRGVQSAT